MLSIGYRSHGVWNSLKQIENQLQGFADKSDERFFDLQKKIKFLRWVLDKSDPMLISTQDMTNIQNHLHQIVSHIPNNANNWAHYPQIEGFFALIFQIISYPRIQKLFKTDVNAFVENCAKRIDAAISEADSKVTVASETINEKLTEFSDSREALLKDIALSKSQVVDLTNELANLRTKVDAQFENWETSLDTEIKEKLGELSETFTEGQAKRREAHEKQLNEIAKTLRTAKSNTDSTIAANKKQITDAKQTLKEMGEKITNEANDLLAKINKIYGIAGNNALSGDFSKTADDESKSYKTFNRFASLFYILIPLSLAYFVFTTMSVGGFSYSDLISRLPITLAFLAPAIYFGNLAQKHRRVSIAFRSLGMRIATFDAYLANFNDVDKNEEKKKMASVFFDAKISADRNAEMSYKDVGKALDQMSGSMEKATKMFARKSG